MPAAARQWCAHVARWFGASWRRRGALGLCALTWRTRKGPAAPGDLHHYGGQQIHCLPFQFSHALQKRTAGRQGTSVGALPANPARRQASVRLRRGTVQLLLPFVAVQLTSPTTPPVSPHYKPVPVIHRHTLAIMASEEQDTGGLMMLQESSLPGKLHREPSVKRGETLERSGDHARMDAASFPGPCLLFWSLPQALLRAAAAGLHGPASTPRAPDPIRSPLHGPRQAVFQACSAPSASITPPPHTHTYTCPVASPQRTA